MTKTTYKLLRIFSLIAIIPAVIVAFLLTAAGATYFASTYASTGNQSVTSTKVANLNTASLSNQFDMEGSANPE